MKVLVIGSTGMLGQALMYEMKRCGIKVIGIARSGADISCDIVDDRTLSNIILSIKPQIIINSAAMVSLAKCEDKPDYAYLINARPASILAEISLKTGIYFIQISTDHYYTGDCNIKHTEEQPIRLINEYGRTKYAGESFALTCQNALVVRTNIVGFRNKIDTPTFVEWAIQNIKNNSPITLFDDYFTSSIHVTQFSSALLDIIEKRPSGVLNLASSEVFSKKAFICALAEKMGHTLTNVKIGSVVDAGDASRAESLGLDVGKAETLLGYKLPNLEEVITSIVEKYENGVKNEIR
ncbi:MAG: SDR family oxidoreductase [Candidatus Methanoperedens sp.]|nr:SDR family oxidoreductase [Candidatus Methanoperedens sp.]